MSDLIRRESLKKGIEKMYGCSWSDVEKSFHFADVINSLPSVEPERKIIYCKDCKFAHLTIKGEVKYCDVWFPEEKTYLSADNFCSSAEKRGE